MFAYNSLITLCILSIFLHIKHSSGILSKLISNTSSKCFFHGPNVQDALDRESKVEFYLDFDNPFPFFSYSQVKPGGYICLVDPVMHLFIDGTVGIRIDNPEDVKVLDIETVMK